MHCAPGRCSISRWTSVVDPTCPLIAGREVGVLARVGFLWTLNACRILDVVDEPGRCFGFVYGTLDEHVEQGEERFLVKLDSANRVWFDLLAISRPHRWYTRIASPVARFFQRRFRRDAAAAMLRAAQSVANRAGRIVGPDALLSGPHSLSMAQHPVLGPWCNAVSGHRPWSVCSNFAAFRRTDHENKYDDPSRKSDEDRRGNQHLAQRLRKFSGRRLGALLEQATAMWARRHFLADLLAAARTEGTGQSHGHILGPAQSAGMTRQRESAAVRSVRERGLRTVPNGSEASGSIRQTRSPQPCGRCHRTAGKWSRRRHSPARRKWHRILGNEALTRRHHAFTQNEASCGPHRICLSRHLGTDNPLPIRT